ncbi:chondroitinase-B domain-containing protein [Geofilum sp. OHC36d9]|uniref:chondroitinase-B domain-containing protein n=1 Tax=Geofilum sp. OHC36d9 TaxID=3458413 RepID=UPI0040337A43
MHRNFFFFIVLPFILFACTTPGRTNQIMVQNNAELQTAIADAAAGDEIVLKNGTWNDVKIEFTSSGTKEKPIVVRAETAGKVFIEGQSYVKFGGDHIVMSGLYFRNGYTPNNAVVEFRLGKEVANHCTFTNCVIENFNQPQRDRQDHWVEFWGRHNELSNCNIIGKSNSGPTVRVQIKGNESIKNYHRIVNNHFGPRPRKGGPHAETVQIGDSDTSMSPSHTFVANNLFDRCNGEVEIISSKTNYNEFRNNIFYKCEGSLVMRHGNYCLIDGNIFIGDDHSDNMGGIRIVNTGHWVINNYFYNLKGNNFRAPLAIMNGIPRSPLNRYNRVTDVVVAYNTWVDCKSPWHFGVGANLEQAEVLPASEIRSARAVRTVIANNIVYNAEETFPPIVAYDKIDGVTFESNLINYNGWVGEKKNVFEYCDFSMTKINNFLFVPSSNVCEVPAYNGFEFESITTGLFGNSRQENDIIGAICGTPGENADITDAGKYGAGWFSTETIEHDAKLFKVTEDDDLLKIINDAASGDIIELAAGKYVVAASIKIDKQISLKSANGQGEVTLVFSGNEKSPLFEMNPNGNLNLKNISLEGNRANFAFATLKENMSALYNLKVEDCRINSFKYVLKAYKESFSDSISFEGCTIGNCDNGIELSQETDDNGNYNVEFLTIDSCLFTSVGANVVDYYRGGYDESTIGGNLKVTNCVFTNCGAKEENKILLNTLGIMNVGISDNIFKNNPVKLVALLWGAKNNRHSGNEIMNSGKIVVQENIELKLMY